MTLSPGSNSYPQNLQFSQVQFTLATRLRTDRIPLCSSALKSKQNHGPQKKNSQGVPPTPGFYKKNIKSPHLNSSVSCSVLLCFSKTGTSANAGPHYQKLYARVTHIWGNRGGQSNRSAMRGPRPGRTALVITVPPASGKYAWTRAYFGLVFADWVTVLVGSTFAAACTRDRVTKHSQMRSLVVKTFF